MQTQAKITAEIEGLSASSSYGGGVGDSLGGVLVTAEEMAALFQVESSVSLAENTPTSLSPVVKSALKPPDATLLDMMVCSVLCVHTSLL